MKQKLVALVLVGVLSSPGLSLAQQHHPEGRDEQTRPGMMGMMAGPSPSLILRQKEPLNLTDSQVERLEAIQKEVTGARESHMAQVRPLHMQAMKALEGDEPDLAGYESALKKLADHHVSMQVEMARFGQRALEVLTPEQRSNVRYGVRLMLDRMGGR